MMNFEDFCQAVERNVVHYLPPQFQEVKLRLQTNRKVNLGDMVDEHSPRQDSVRDEGQDLFL